MKRLAQIRQSGGRTTYYGKLCWNKTWHLCILFSIMLILVAPTCWAGGVEQDEAGTFSLLTVEAPEVPPPPPPPPGGPAGPPPTPPRGDIVAEMLISLMKRSYNPGDTVRALVDINNTRYTMNDVILRLSVRDDEIYAMIEEVTTINPGMNQRILEIDLPEDILPGDYIAHVEMIEPNGDITWASAMFTVVEPISVPLDWVLIAAFVLLLVVIFLARGVQTRKSISRKAM